MNIINFPYLRQTYNYDCGDIVLQSVLAYYGIDIREGRIIKWAKTNEYSGTSIISIEKIVKKYNLKIVSKAMTINEVKKFIDKKIPVIILLQVWSLKKNVNWEKHWSDGHFVIAIAYGKPEFN